MKVLWIGAGVGPETKRLILKQGGKLLSAFVSQNNLIAGLDALGVDMDTLNGMNVDESVLHVIPFEYWSRNGKNSDVSVGYKNVLYVNRLLKQRALCREAKKWAYENQGHAETVICIYGMHAPFLAAAAVVRRVIPRARICLIVPDLPQYMDLKMRWFKKCLKALDWMRIRYYLKNVDKYVLYAEPMASFLGIKDDSWIVMEGSYDSEQKVPDTNMLHDGKITVMYSGVLDLRYGIPELLDAMKLLDDRYELWLTGDGNAAEMIRQRAKEDSRIRFFGYLPSREALLAKQASATMLISPRRDTEEASRYCFPSKLFEYLASGRPVISCFLEGIPEEYHKFLYELPNVSAEEIAQTIREVADLSEKQRSENGERARRFVLAEKNNIAQGRRIMDFIMAKTI